MAGKYTLSIALKKISSGGEEQAVMKEVTAQCNHYSDNIVTIRDYVEDIQDDQGCHIRLHRLCPRTIPGSLFHVEVCEGLCDCGESNPVLRDQEGLPCLEEVISTL